jgi:site-specific recombinase XerD
LGYKKHLEQLERQKSGIVAMVSRVKQFLKYLIRCSIQVPDITVSVLDAFVAHLSSKYSSSAKSNILFTLRDFLSFLEDLSVVDKGSSSLVGKIITHRQEKLASWYTQKEIEQILDCIDTSSLDGKRDYAILMTASHLGMRISDICRLTLGSFDWERQTVQFIQKKTNNMEVLPIPEILILALADYIKNARPSTNHKELFVTLNAYGENTVSPGTSYLMLNKYMMLAGINTEGKHHGMHALRHSLASSLLGNDNPLPVITGILGHSSSEVTSQYLWMASDRLRPLALEVPPWIMV